MANALMAWLATDEGTCALFGFSAYALFTVWRKLSVRWTHWFPLLTKVTRWALYGAAVGVLILFFSAATAQKGLFDSLGGIYALVGAAVVPLLNLALLRLRPKEKVRRGARISGVSEVNRQTAKLPKADFHESFQIGGINIPRSAEPYHFFVVGSTGSGKSVAITQLLDDLEARGDLALVVDSGGGFCERFYRPGRDHILNPFDERCVPWSPTCEMAGPWDAESLARSMVPDGVGESKEWNGYAQTLVASVLKRLSERQQLSIRDLLYYVQAAPVEELGPLLAGTSAAAQLGSDKTFGSIRTIASKYLSTYAYLQDHPEPFSVARMIQAERAGFLFLTYRDDQLDSLKNMIACVLDVAARTLLSLPANSRRRVWLIIDEFASIGKVQSIEAVATKARKVGGCLLLGLQSVSQLKESYGEHGAQTILSCLSSWLVLRCSDADTAEYISKYIGDTEVSRMTRGESQSDTGGSDSLSEQIQTQRAVLPVELQRLANLTGFFKLAGDYPLCNIKLDFPRKREPATKAYASRDFVAHPMLSFDAPTGAAPAAGTQAEATQPAQAVQADAPAVQAPAPEPQASDVRRGTLGKPVRIRRRSPMDSGPAALEVVLRAMAEESENGL